jgi:predicted permease
VKKRAPREKQRFYAGNAAGADVAFGEKTDRDGPAAGVMLSAIGIKMPDLLLAAIKPLGLSATAAALFLTGVILSARKLQLNALVITSTIAKLLIQPFIAWGIVMFLVCTVPWRSPRS